MVMAQETKNKEQRLNNRYSLIMTSSQSMKSLLILFDIKRNIEDNFQYVLVCRFTSDNVPIIVDNVVFFSFPMSVLARKLKLQMHREPDNNIYNVTGPHHHKLHPRLSINILKSTYRLRVGCHTVVIGLNRSQYRIGNGYVTWLKL